MRPADAAVHVLDDNSAVRSSLEALLPTYGFKVFTYASAAELLEGLSAAQPGCILLDLHMPRVDGPAALATLRATGCDWPALIITADPDVSHAAAAVRAGAADLLQKPFGADEIVNAIRAAWSDLTANSGSTLPMLSAREAEIVALLAEGGTSKEIARRLDISPRTVDAHRARILNKTGARNTADLVASYLRTTRRPTPTISA